MAPGPPTSSHESGLSVDVISSISESKSAIDAAAASTGCVLFRRWPLLAAMLPSAALRARSLEMSPAVSKAARRAPVFACFSATFAEQVVAYRGILRGICRFNRGAEFTRRQASCDFGCRIGSQTAAERLPPKKATPTRRKRTTTAAQSSYEPLHTFSSKLPYPW